MKRENRSGRVIRVGTPHPHDQDSNSELLRSNMIRESIANGFIATGRTLGQLVGLQLAVEVSDHSISLSMEKVDKDTRAWDTNLYKNGNLFLKGYANPVKLRLIQNEGLENPDTVDVEDGETDSEAHEEAEEQNAEVIASSRYRDYMRQDLISQLLTPESRWNMLVWGILALGALVFFNMILTLYATGSF